MKFGRDERINVLKEAKFRFSEPNLGEKNHTEEPHRRTTHSASFNQNGSTRLLRPILTLMKFTTKFVSPCDWTILAQTYARDTLRVSTVRDIRAGLSLPLSLFAIYLILTYRISLGWFTSSLHPSLQARSRGSIRLTFTFVTLSRLGVDADLRYEAELEILFHRI